MNDTDVPWHYLRGNKACRYPRRIITFDSEARVERTRQGERHTFRNACASFDLIDKDTLEPTKSELVDFDDHAALWEWVTRHARSHDRTIVWAHNLAYDLRVTRAFEWLPANGWQCDFIYPDTTKVVARFSRQGRKLTFTDTFAWWPVSLERIAAALGLEKVPLPRQNGSAEAWRVRCRQDVIVTRAAVLRLLSWLEANDMGNWRLTGAAQAMGAFRHRFMTDRQLLVHREPAALDAERRAAWSGRCEIYRWGPVRGPLEEWDFELAYLNLATSLDLPVALHGSTGRLDWGRYERLARRFRVVADVVVETAAPVVPAESGGRTVWPVGRFRTTAWDVELLAARARGARIEVEAAWLYRRGGALRRWGDWLLRALAAGNPDTDELTRILLKHWARALVGRFGLRYPDWRDAYSLDGCDVEYLPCLDVDTGEQTAYLQVGSQVRERIGLVEARDSMPAVMSYVMAAARIKLLEACEAAGDGNVFYVDTDSLLVNAAGGRRLRQWAADNTCPPLRRKAVYAGASLRAPRSIVVDNRMVQAGVPRNARSNGDGSFTGEVWEGLGESFKRHRPSEVRVTAKQFRLRAPDRRRHHLPNGATAPYILDVEGAPQ